MAESILLSVAAKIMGSAVGLVCGKPYDSLTSKLKDGDLTNEKVREIMVRDLTEIKAKLDCLSLKDLDSSYSFLREGVRLLNLTLENQKSSEGQAQATGISNDGTSCILNAALPLPQAIQRLEISSEGKERFVSAKDCFKEARKAATHAFNNKSLGIKDRIMACKLRVAARILETGLEDPEAATTACLLSLEELHGLPAIQDMFSVFLNGGFRSKLKKTERLENIMSVLSINDALFDFAAKYSSQYPNVFTWPGIELTDRTVNPILNTRDIFAKTSTGEELAQQLNRTVFDERLRWSHFAVNSRGEVILLCYDKILVSYPTGESKDVMFPDPTESNLVDQRRKAVAVDSDDNVYVVRWLKTRRRDQDVTDKNYVYDHVLNVFNEIYNLKHCQKLDFLEAEEYDDVKIAVDKNKNLIMIKLNDNQAYVCDNTGQLKFKFERDGRLVYSLSTSGKNDIIIPSDDQHAVNLFTQEGNLKSTVKVPEGHDIRRVAFHHGICKIIFLTYMREQDSYFLFCYSEIGDMETSVFLCKRDVEKGLFVLDMSNHSSGLVAVSYVEQEDHFYLSI